MKFSILKLILESVYGLRHKNIIVFSSNNYLSGVHIQVTQQEFKNIYGHIITPKMQLV